MSEGYKFQLNIKLGSGYDAHLFNIVGHDADEFQKNVEFALTSADAIVGAATAFEAAYSVKKPQSAPKQDGPSWSRGGTQQSQQASSDRPEGPAPSCRHGDMKWVPGGISKRTNKAYKGFWGCTGDRSEQCESVNA